MKDAHSTVRGMEYLIKDFIRYGDLLHALSHSSSEIDHEVVRLIGLKLSVDAENLDTQYEQALELFKAEARR